MYCRGIEGLPLQLFGKKTCKNMLTKYNYKFLYYLEKKKAEATV